MLKLQLVDVAAWKGAHMKRLLGLSLAVLVLTFLAACEEARLRIDRVEPDEGITAGGDQVNILAAGLQPGKTGVRVSFGRHVAEQVVISSKDKINLVTPSGDKGPVDVTLEFDDGQSFKIPTGFRYVDPKETEDLRKAFFNKPKGAQKK
jgi:hypothetical protein